MPKTSLLARADAAFAAVGRRAQGKPTIGVAMPTKSSARPIDDGNPHRQANEGAVTAWCRPICLACSRRQAQLGEGSD
jgi:hypothetical protein